MNELEQLQAAFEKARQNGDKAMAKNFAQQIVALEGKQPQVQEEQPVGQGGSILDPLLKGATFNLSDEAMGGIGATSGKFMNILKQLTGVGPGLAPSGITGEDLSMQDMYEGTRDVARQDEEEFAIRNPKTALAAEIGGSLTTGGFGGTKLLASQTLKQAPKAVQALSVPALFAAEGGAYGFGEGEGLEESLTKAGTTAATSAVVGPVINKLLKTGIEKIATPFAKKVREAGQASTSLGDLKTGYKAAYKVADDSGVQISESAYTPFKAFIKRQIAKDYGAAKYIKGMENPTEELFRLKNPTIKELMGVRNMIDVAIKGNKNSKTAGMKLDKQIVDYIEYLAPVDVTKGANKVLGVGKKIKEGDALFNRHAQGTTIQKMIDRKATSGADKKLSAEARKILNSEKKQLGMDDKVIQKLDDMEEGTGLKQLIRFGASLNPSMASARNPVATMMTGGAGFMAGGPVGAAIAAAVPTGIGVAFTQIANKMSKVEIEKIKHIAMNKGQEELADIIERMVGKYTTGATAGTLAVTPHASELKDMMTQ